MLLIAFLVGAAVALIAQKVFEHSEPIEMTASTTCAHCEAPRWAHHKETTKCPCSWVVGKTQEPIHTIYFFKPMTVGQWMKYRGIEDGGAP